MLPANALCIPFDERIGMMRWLLGLYATDRPKAESVTERAYAHAQRCDGCSYGEAFLSMRVVRQGHQFVVGRLVEDAIYHQYLARATA